MADSEAFQELVEELRNTCSDFEDDLADWEIVDALRRLKIEYE